ncbi:MAG: sigma-70 family RNA polymerase sigma factor [Clostridia bacterium]|nr:sigma-70 family RNA polymerase sigma factor [Clostridia bacterium]
MLDADTVYREYRELVYGYLYRLCRDSGLSEELTQETFFQAVRQWNRFRGESGIGTWLCAIARNQFYSALRRPNPVLTEEVPEQTTPGFADAVADHSLAMGAYRALHDLPEPYREVFTLRTFCELKHAEIAELFGKSESWARVTCYRAKQMLSEAMKGEKA